MKVTLMVNQILKYTSKHTSGHVADICRKNNFNQVNTQCETHLTPTHYKLSQFPIKFGASQQAQSVVEKSLLLFLRISTSG